MSLLFAERALLPDGWRRDVRLETDADGMLTAVTPDADARGAERLSGPVVPGMPNLHSHAFQRAMAGLAERRGAAGSDDDFWTWRTRMYELVQRLQPEQMHAVAAWLYGELLCGGFTAVAEFHYVHRAPDGSPYDDPAETSVQVVEAARRAGIAITHLPVVYERGGFDGRPLGHAQRRFAAGPDLAAEIGDALRRRYAAEHTVRCGAALHSLRAVAPASLDEAVRAAREGDPETPVHVHAAEQVAEVDDCVAALGARPVAWLLDQAPVDGHWCMVHATCLDDGEVAGLARSGAVAGLCPTTEADLGDGVFRLAPYLAAGGRLGIGTDSHVGRTVAGELRLLEWSQRLLARRRNVAADAESPSVGARLVRDALRGGAAALGQPVGRLAPGSRADLVVLDGSHPDLEGLDGDDLLDVWLFGSRDLVRDVAVAGRWQVRERRHRAHEELDAAYRAALRALRS